MKHRLTCSALILSLAHIDTEEEECEEEEQGVSAQGFVMMITV